jgi:hypothetical protein
MLNKPFPFDHQHAYHRMTRRDPSQFERLLFGYDSSSQAHKSTGNPSVARARHRRGSVWNEFAKSSRIAANESPESNHQALLWSAAAFGLLIYEYSVGLSITYSVIGPLPSAPWVAQHGLAVGFRVVTNQC